MGLVVDLGPIDGHAQQEADDQGHLRASARHLKPRERRRGSPLPVHLSQCSLPPGIVSVRGV